MFVLRTGTAESRAVESIGFATGSPGGDEGGGGGIGDEAALEEYVSDGTGCNVDVDEIAAGNIDDVDEAGILDGVENVDTVNSDIVDDAGTAAALVFVPTTDSGIVCEERAASVSLYAAICSRKARGTVLKTACATPSKTDGGSCSLASSINSLQGTDLHFRFAPLPLEY